MEHRLGTRYPVNLTVRLLGSGTHSRGRIVNLSLSGALIRTQARLRPLSPITLELGSVNQTVPTLVIGHVIRETPAGVAIEWSEFAPPPITMLLAMRPDRVRHHARPQARPHRCRHLPVVRVGLFEHRHEG